MPEKDLNQRFSTQQKMRLVADSWHLKDEEYGRFLRRSGISSIEIESWREQMAEGMDEGKPISRGEKRSLQQRIELLKKELKRAQGVIAFQKKFQKIWEKDAEAKVPKKSEKKPAKRSKK